MGAKLLDFFLKNVTHYYFYLTFGTQVGGCHGGSIWGVSDALFLGLLPLIGVRPKSGFPSGALFGGRGGGVGGRGGWG